ncbi:hypothetical protein [Nocardia stercoris]|uniref:hypothetical protein n=1 Tax=Nocardia stercoris TaxID=2483361 RepID=UPI0011C4521B|nr:hypothetical protein [Nocardia stercoris]
MGDDSGGVDWCAVWGADLPVPENNSPMPQTAISVEPQPVPPSPDPQPTFRQQPPIRQHFTRNKRLMLISSGVLLVLALLTVVGVVTRSDWDSRARVPAPGYGTCDKLGPLLPAKARGLQLDTSLFGDRGQQCVWSAKDPAVISTWLLTVSISVEADPPAAHTRFDLWRAALENPSWYDIRTAPLPNVGDQAVAGPIPNANYIFGAKAGEPMKRVDLHSYTQPGVATLVRARNAVIEVRWVGADYPPGTRADYRDHVPGTPLPLAQAESEAVALTEDIIQLLGD